MSLGKNFRTKKKKFIPVSDLDPNAGFGFGCESGIRIRIRILHSDPDPNLKLSVSTPLKHSEKLINSSNLL
jgi:hypothetical protein